jgi:predicted nucleic acid-binding protein
LRRVWVDANVLLRFLTGEPPELAKRARSFMQEVHDGEVEARVTTLVLAEVVWVLKSFYKHPMVRIAEVLVPLVTAEGVSTADPEVAVAALHLAAETGVDFADAHLALLSQKSGEPVCTFDRTDFAKMPCEWMEPPSASGARNENALTDNGATPGGAAAEGPDV